MQHKQRRSKVGILLAMLAALMVGGVALLMKLDIPAPQKPVEKQLDAKAFLEPKS